MTTPQHEPAVHLCPLCGQHNQCAMAASQRADGPCWCTTVTFSAPLLARVPVVSQNKACICAACAANQPEGTSAKN